MTPIPMYSAPNNGIAFCAKLKSDILRTPPVDRCTRARMAGGRDLIGA
jgi:hypothetical protein